MKDGDDILIVCEGRTLPAKVVMISTNQVAALIAFEGILGGHVGSMPVQRWNKDLGLYRSIINGTEVKLREGGA
jgi:hypothetical protein